MFTQLIEGETPLGIDPKILAAVDDTSGNPHPHSRRAVGILNDAGALYRVIVTEGDKETSQVCGRLLALGLRDRVGFDDARLREIDTITGREIRTLWSGLFQLGDTAHPIPPVPRL